MTPKEWQEKTFVKEDIKYLQSCGFMVKFENNTDTRFNSEYSLVISDGRKEETLNTPYTIEQVARVIKMYRRIQTDESKTDIYYNTRS